MGGGGIVCNYGNEAKEKGKIKIKGARQEGNGSTQGPGIMTNLQEDRNLLCNTSENKITGALQMGIQLKTQKL